MMFNDIFGFFCITGGLLMVVAALSELIELIKSGEIRAIHLLQYSAKNLPLPVLMLVGGVYLSKDHLVQVLYSL